METIYPQLGETLIFFLTTMAEMAILFVGISFLVGVINEFLPQDKVKRWLSGRHGRGYLIGSISFARIVAKRVMPEAELGTTSLT